MGSNNFVHLGCAPWLFFRHIGEIKNPEKEKFSGNLQQNIVLCEYSDIYPF
jgi:hypothetical protein